jgi:hypothetical protein
MTSRRQLKSNRFLPEFVTRFKDRHGKDRLRFRRNGYPSYEFKAPLGTEDFRIEYAACMDPAAPAEAAAQARIERATPGTLLDLFNRYVSVPQTPRAISRHAEEGDGYPGALRRGQGGAQRRRCALRPSMRSSPRHALRRAAATSCAAASRRPASSARNWCACSRSR